jgi:hypothetical protein
MTTFVIVWNCFLIEDEVKRKNTEGGNTEVEIKLEFLLHLDERETHPEGIGYGLYVLRVL